MSDNEISLVDDEVEIVEHLGSLSFSEDGRCLNSDGGECYSSLLFGTVSRHKPHLGTKRKLKYLIRSGWSMVNHHTREEMLQYSSINLPYSSKLTRVRFKLVT